MVSRVSEDGSRLRTYLEVAAGIVTVLAVAVPSGIFLADHFRSTPTPTASRSSGDTTSTTDPTVRATTAEPAIAAAQVFLDTLTPDTGSTNLAGLPRKLQNQPGYSRPVTIPCGSNEVGDQQRDVTYLPSGRFRSLRAVVRPYKETSDESQVEVTVYPDNRPPTVVRLDVNSSQEISVDLDGTKKLTIRVVCGLPGAAAVLTDAALSRA